MELHTKNTTSIGMQVESHLLVSSCLKLKMKPLHFTTLPVLMDNVFRSLPFVNIFSLYIKVTI